MNITKIVGTGNDFLFIDARDVSKGSASAVPRERRSALAMKLCDRHFGVGADGLVFVEPNEAGADLTWDFYNNDGSIAEMCGNASRCMGRWAQIKLGLDKVSFDTMAGRVRTEVVGDEISLSIDYLTIAFKELEFQLEGSPLKATFINTGVPHAVFEIAKIADARSAQSVIKALRFHPGAGPRGANVTFVAPRATSAGAFDTVTFERGVEDFTLSCGTGVLAAAAVTLRDQPKPAEAKLTTPGGLLTVNYGQNWAGAVLKGPAVFLFDAVLSEELVR